MLDIKDYGLENINGKIVVSSRVLAFNLGKEHSKVLITIDNLINNGCRQMSLDPLFIENMYINNQNKQSYREYLITKQGFLLYMFSIQGYEEFKLAYINKYDYMERTLNILGISTEQQLILDIVQAKSVQESALALKKYNDLIVEPLKLENKELKPKANYYDFVLQSPSLVTVKAMASDYGKSAQWLNKYLNEKSVQYKQGGTWYLYTKYSELGYAKLVTTAIDDEHTREHLKWTHKGRLFVYNLLKEDNILPLLEREENN